MTDQPKTLRPLPNIPDVSRAAASREVSGPWSAHVRVGSRRVADLTLYASGAAVLAAPNGRVVVCPSLTVAVENVGVDAEIRWLELPTSPMFQRGVSEAEQDAMENCPFASVGGLSAREGTLTLPHYISDADAAEWARGYLRLCCAMYGEDWRTAEFGWRPALSIPGASTPDPAEVSE